MRPLAALSSLSSIFNLLRPSTVHIVGDAYLDMLAKVEHLPEWDSDTMIETPIQTLAGGSALNTAVQLNSLLTSRRQRGQDRPFRRCVLHSRLGDDLYGDLVAARIRKAGVQLSAVRRGGQGVCICLSGERDRAFVSYKGTVSNFTVADLNQRLLFSRSSSHLHFAAYFDCVGLQSAVPMLLKRAKACGATTSVVPQDDATDQWAGLHESLRSGLVDVLICNQKEAAGIAGVQYASAVPTWDETDRVVQILQALGVPLIVLTLGPDGAIAMAADQWWFQSTKPVANPMDTTGAGDAFAAGFLFGWCGARDVRRGLVYGCACGSAAVGQLGGSDPLDAKAIEATMIREGSTGSFLFGPNSPELWETVSTAGASASSV
ncbi:hypothetical protein AB1Y20_019879 [Prymnesium parvum]|uniref:Carbohydrate kinase PfkB domain-containing protein n=1 Tax=Prymnesium parvum TaxID=97485 RepID=A0AB34JS69_PRYPA